MSETIVKDKYHFRAAAYYRAMLNACTEIAPMPGVEAGTPTCPTPSVEQMAERLREQRREREAKGRA